MSLDIHRCRIDAIDLLFELLPPGQSNARSVLMKSLEKGAIRDFREKLDFSRIDAVEGLGSTIKYCGRRGWNGYGVFVFPYTDWVVLETPLKGNATYVLAPNWRELIPLTKEEIWTEHAGSYLRVIHRGESWLPEIKNALNLGRIRSKVSRR